MNSDHIEVIPRIIEPNMAAVYQSNKPATKLEVTHKPSTSTKNELDSSEKNNVSFPNYTKMFLYVCLVIIVLGLVFYISYKYINSGKIITPIIPIVPTILNSNISQPPTKNVSHAKKFIIEENESNTKLTDNLNEVPTIEQYNNYNKENKSEVALSSTVIQNINNLEIEDYNDLPQLEAIEEVIKDVEEDEENEEDEVITDTVESEIPIMEEINDSSEDDFSITELTNYNKVLNNSELPVINLNDEYFNLKNAINEQNINLDLQQSNIDPSYSYNDDPNYINTMLRKMNNEQNNKPNESNNINSKPILSKNKKVIKKKIIIK